MSEVLSLESALQRVAFLIFVDGENLLDYATHAPHIGRDDDNGTGSMSLHAVEAQVLYAMVRILRPAVLVEVGVAQGASSIAILTALRDNDFGHLHSYDVEESSGSLVPEALKERWTLTIADAFTAEYPDHVDFIFEDGKHGYEWTRQMLTICKQLKPKVLVSHDYYTHLAYEGFDVEKAFVEVFGDVDTLGILIQSAFTGLGIWSNPDRHAI